MRYWRGYWEKQGSLDKVLSIILVVAIVGALVTLGYVIAVPKVGERFTELYILGPDGKAEDYPTSLHVGDEGKIILGVVNHEQMLQSYEVRVRGESIKVYFEGEEVDTIPTGILENDEKWEEPIIFIPLSASSSTILASPALKEQRTLEVAAADGFEVGDYVQIGISEDKDTEFAQIDAIAGNTITLKADLRYDHDVGAIVVESQKVEFLLYKAGGGEPYLECHLWITVT